MKGLELSRLFYEEYGKAMLENDFPELIDLIAVGLVGSGSERYGYDDEVSTDHDFEAGFCIFLPDEDTLSRRDAFLLERAYQKLPREFNGVKRELLSPVGGNRNGPIRTADFYLAKIGSADGSLSVEQWLTLPDYALAEATNGEVFFDNYGEFTKIRQAVLNMPNDVRLKRLAGNILLMAQSGQYNYSRCLKHNEPEAAQLACNEFVNSALKVIFLLNRRYAPYYKWSFRALREFDTTTADRLSVLLSGASSEEKISIIEEISAYVSDKLIAEEITTATGSELEKHAYSVNNQITDGNIRNLNIFAAI